MKKYTSRRLKILLNSVTSREEWNEVNEIVKMRYGEFNKEQHTFKVGENVFFCRRSRKYFERMIGTVVKINRKNIKVDVKVGYITGIWTVPKWKVGKATRNDLIQLSLEKMEHGI